MRNDIGEAALVTSTTGSPLRVSSALVATVVPTLTAATATWGGTVRRRESRARRAGPDRPPRRRRSPRAPCGRAARRRGERPMTSVKVPAAIDPRTASPPPAPGGRWDDWLNVSIACIIRA